MAMGEDEDEDDIIERELKVQIASGKWKWTRMHKTLATVMAMLIDMNGKGGELNLDALNIGNKQYWQSLQQ